jgi:hypothetical protein
MTSVPPPGYESRGSWGFENPDPQEDPSRRLLQLAAGLSVLLIALVAFAYLRGSSETSLNPIADAAERTEAVRGARMTISATYTSPELPFGFMAHGQGIINGHTGRGHVEMSATVGSRRLQIEAISDRRSIYLRSSMFASELPAGKEWVGVEPLLGHDPETALAGSSDVKQQLQMLQAAGGDVEAVGEENVRGASTTRYRGTIDLERVVSMLREEGKADVALVMERMLKGESTSIPVEVWIDENGLVRRVRQVMTIPTNTGDPGLQMDMQITLYDFGVKPRIQLPPASEVFDTTPLLEAQLGLSGVGPDRRARKPAKARSQLSRTAFRARVGEVCSELKREFAPFERKSEALGRSTGHLIVQQGLDSPATKRALRQMAVFFERVVPIAADGYDRLVRIAPPADLEDRYRRYLSLGERQIGLFRAMARALELGDFELTRRLNHRVEKLEQPTKRLAKRLGARACEEGD